MASADAVRLYGREYTIVYNTIAQAAAVSGRDVRETFQAKTERGRDRDETRRWSVARP